MTVHFIGAGPGAADLMTIRGRDLLARCPVCLYAGSLVPPELLKYCPEGARVIDSAAMTLDELESEYIAAHSAGLDVARLHSGDLSIYSALAEQLRRLKRQGIPYTLTPGVPAFAAAAAVLGRELTVPGIAQSVVLTRMPGRASRMPSMRWMRSSRN
jgi:precorrin-4/cobalt-precorrin-4 C11-methyltransferase